MLKNNPRTFKIESGQAGQRADIVLAGHFPAFTRSSLESLFDNNLVTIGGKPIKPSRKLAAGQTLTVDTSSLFSSPSQIDLPIIYEDDDVVVLNKPAGVLTHSKGAINSEATVASWLLQHLKKTNHNIISSFPGSDPGNTGNNRLGVVHRLDRATSGVIIAAKNEKSLKWLQKEFSTRKTNKIYLAIVEGVPDSEAVVIDAPIERNPKHPQTFRVGSGGREAQTKYRVLKKLHKSSNLYSLLELNPRTGRTHQLRVHLKYIGHPIVGDRVYGHEGDNMYLYAKSLEITLPGGQRMKFEAPEPKIFKEFEL